MTKLVRSTSDRIELLDYRIPNDLIESFKKDRKIYSIIHSSKFCGLDKSRMIGMWQWLNP